MNYSIKFFIFTILCTLTSCDDGKIYPDEREVLTDGLSVTVKGEFEGCRQYDNSGYAIVVAAFKEYDDFAIISKPLTDGTRNIILKNIDSSASSVEICVISRLREKVFSIASMPIDAAYCQNYTFDAGQLNVAPFSVINNNIFASSCVQCHGATGNSAASLDLTTEEAYRNLVNVHSTVIDGDMRVRPGDAHASTLWQAVASDISESWRFDHSNLLSEETSGFIQEWINNGADDK